MMKSEQITKLLSAIRGLANQEQYKKIGKQLNRFSDEELLKKFFRKHDDDSVSLSRFGVKILQQFFEHWTIDLKTPLSGKQHLLLSRACQLPYFISTDRLVIFDQEVGVLMTLGQGDNSVIENMF